MNKNKIRKTNATCINEPKCNVKYRAMQSNWHYWILCHIICIVRNVRKSAKSAISRIFSVADPMGPNSLPYVKKSYYPALILSRRDGRDRQTSSSSFVRSSPRRRSSPGIESTWRGHFTRRTLRAALVQSLRWDHFRVRYSES